MSGTFQLLAHCAALGGSIGIALPYFAGRPWPLLAMATITWMGFWSQLADAAWIHSWGKGRDWIDRIGILIRGSGFALITFSILNAPARTSIVLAFARTGLYYFWTSDVGTRCIRLGIDLTEKPIDG
jgi:hypothetical protein